MSGRLLPEFIKRLFEGWRLEVDATIQYALGYDQDNKTWWKKFNNRGIWQLIVHTTAVNLPVYHQLQLLIQDFHPLRLLPNQWNLVITFIYTTVKAKYILLKP